MDLVLDKINKISLILTFCFFIVIPGYTQEIADKNTGPEFQTEKKADSSQVKFAKYKKYEFDKISKHIQEILGASKRADPFVKWHKDMTIKYRASFLNDRRLKQLFDQRMQELKNLTGLDIVKAKQNDSVAFGFIFFNDIKALINCCSNVFKSVSSLINKDNDQFTGFLIDRFSNPKISLQRFSGETKTNYRGKEITYLTFSIHFIRPRVLTYESLDAVFLNRIFMSILNVENGSQISESLTFGREEPHLLNTIPAFDIALIKAIYSDEVTHGIDRKVAAEIIAKKVFIELNGERNGD